LSLVDAVGDGTLYRLDPGPELATLVEGVGLSNGLGWAPSGRTFYFTDTVSGRIDQFTYDMQTGAATERRPFVAELPGTPDGLCVDSDGCVWIALWGGHAVRRYTPRGQLDAIVEVPVPNVTSCAFGGDVLYITTAAAGLRPEEFPHAGDIFAVDAGVSGPSVSKWKPVGSA
jgi:sugar lactone lactonase YvrE